MSATAVSRSGPPPRYYVATRGASILVHSSSDQGTSWTQATLTGSAAALPPEPARTVRFQVRAPHDRAVYLIQTAIACTPPSEQTLAPRCASAQTVSVEFTIAGSDLDVDVSLP